MALNRMDTKSSDPNFVQLTGDSGFNVVYRAPRPDTPMRSKVEDRVTVLGAWGTKLNETLGDVNLSPAGRMDALKEVVNIVATETREQGQSIAADMAAHAKEEAELYAPPPVEAEVDQLVDQATKRPRQQTRSA